MVNYTVPAANIAAMTVSLLISFAMPVGACIYLKRRGASLKSFFIGCATFVVFALVLEQLLHAVVLQRFAGYFSTHITAYAAYGGLAAGIFEESGRFLAMRFLMKKSLTKKNALMYGAGHGGIEAILILGMSSISNIAASVMINSGRMDVLALPAESAAQLLQLSALPAWMFLAGGVERVAAMGLHICLSYYVYRAVKEKRVGFFLRAVFVHFAVDAQTVLASALGLHVMLLEAILLAVVIVGVLGVRAMYRDEDSVESETESGSEGDTEAT